jgi:hypothetical protein
MTKSFYIVSFLATFTLGIGAMFEFLVWPYRGMIVFAGFLLLNFGVIPIYFFQKIKNLRND